MAFVYLRGPLVMDWYQKAASQVLAVGDLLIPSSGYATIAAATSLRIIGINQKPVASTDSDYAGHTAIPVMIPTDQTEFIADVTAGTFTQANVGAQFDIDSAGSGINVGGTSHKQIVITGFISASKAICKIAGAMQYTNPS